MTDKFMSGWGGATNKISKYVIKCDTIKQAKQIERIATYERNEMIYVHITHKQPKFYPLRKFHVSIEHWDSVGGIWKEGWQD